MGKIKTKIRRNVLLKDYSTFRIGGKAKYFLVAKTKPDLISAIEFAKKNKIPFFLLGGGSNVLFPDKGFKGLVIKMNCDFINKKENGLYEVGAGTLLAKLIAETIKNNLTGLEWGIGIPGTLGGAICGNSGAYGHATAESIVSVKVLNLKTLKTNWITSKTSGLTVFMFCPSFLLPERMTAMT